MGHIHWLQPPAFNSRILLKSTVHNPAHHSCNSHIQDPYSGYDTVTIAIFRSCHWLEAVANLNTWCRIGLCVSFNISQTYTWGLVVWGALNMGFMGAYARLVRAGA